jgi:hypothetical protein
MLSNSYFFEIEGAASLELGMPISHPLNAACVEECKPSNLQETYVAWLPKKNTLLKQESRKKPAGKEKKRKEILLFQEPRRKKERRKNPVLQYEFQRKKKQPR